MQICYCVIRVFISSDIAVTDMTIPAENQSLLYGLVLYDIAWVGYARSWRGYGASPCFHRRNNLLECFDNH